MNKQLFSFLLIITVSLSSCFDTGKTVKGNGHVISENRTISKADRIKLSGDMDVIIEQGPTAVRVETDQNLLPFIITTSGQDWLEVKKRSNTNLRPTVDIKIYITTPNITDLKISGSGNIICNEKFSSSNGMSFQISGSGDIKADVNAPSVNVSISGSGNLNITGETRDVEIQIAGSGNYNGSKLKAENAEVKIAGSGDAALFADANLKASITGSGNVKYAGNALVDKKIVGSGSVNRIE